MNWLADLYVNHFIIFTLVLARTSGLVIAAPVMGGGEVPMQFRALFAVALAMLVAPAQWATAVSPPASVFGYLLLLGGELLIGLVLGLGVTIIFSSLQLAGQVIGQTSGMALAEVFDPSLDASIAMVGQLLHTLALAVFVLIGGHRLLVGGLLETFRAVSPGAGIMAEGVGEGLVTLAAQSLALGLRVAAPATAAVLLATLVMGLVSRTLPQLNVLAFGFGLNAMVTLLVLGASLGGAMLVFQDSIEPAIKLAIESLEPSTS